MQDILDRLLSKVSIQDNGCWMYMGGRGRGDYGHFWVDGKTRRAHIVSYELHCGPTNGLRVLHECDNTWCINPDHLFLGTDQDNIDDMIAKGRDGFKGDRNGRAILNIEKVALIKEMLLDKSQQYIANELGVSRSTIAAVKSGRNWGQL